MDLSTTYLGLELKNPLVAGASPFSKDVGTARSLEDAGVAAIVMYSLFEEQLGHESAALDHFEDFGAESFAEAQTYVPATPIEYTRGPDDYLAHIAALKNAVDIPVIASLNGRTEGGWVEFAKKMQDAGADALELNIYHIATDPAVTGHEIENRYIDVLKAVKEEVRIPLALKIGPYFSSMANFAKRLDTNGADGLVLFNRFYQPDIDLEQLEVNTDLVLSAPHEMRLPLRWIAILNPLIEADLAATTGVYAYSDVLKLMMAGAKVTMLVAAMLHQGPAVIKQIIGGVMEWMEEKEYESIRQMQGSMNYKSVEDASGFERANYMKALQEYK